MKAFADTLRRDLFELVALCRIVPGLDLFVFAACGWTRVPAARFLLASLIVSALYLPLMLYLVVVFGDALDDHVGLWTWPALLAVAAVAGFVRNRIFTLQEAAPSIDAARSRLVRPRFRFYEALPAVLGTAPWPRSLPGPLRRPDRARGAPCATRG